MRAYKNTFFFFAAATATDDHHIMSVSTFFFAMVLEHRRVSFSFLVKHREGGFAFWAVLFSDFEREKGRKRGRGSNGRSVSKKTRCCGSLWMCVLFFGKKARTEKPPFFFSTGGRRVCLTAWFKRRRDAFLAWRKRMINSVHWENHMPMVARLGRRRVVSCIRRPGHAFTPPERGSVPNFAVAKGKEKEKKKRLASTQQGKRVVFFMQRGWEWRGAEGHHTRWVR